MTMKMKALVVLFAMTGLGIQACGQHSLFGREGVIHERSADSPAPDALPLGGEAGNQRPADTTTPTGGGGFQDTFQQNTYAVGTKIDALWVIDNSGSMGNDQASLAANAAQYTSNFLSGSQLDLQLGVITTGWNSNSAIEISHFGGVLSGSSLDQFGSIVDGVGTHGSGDEQGLESARRALDPAYGSLNPGFMRSDALLQLFIVSDEEAGGDCNSYSSAPGETAQELAALCSELGGIDDESKNDGKYAFVPIVQNYVDFFTALKGGAANVRANVVVGFKTGTCNGGNNVIAEVGYRYQSFAQALGGVSLDLCSDWGETLDVLGKISAGLRQCFPLKNPVTEAASIVVTVDGNSIASSLYTYNGATNQICFNSLSTVPVNSTIVVTYD